MADNEKLVEKHYCYDHPSAYGSNDATTMALMANGGMGNQMWNNPMMYLVWMWMMRWMNNGEYGFSGAENYNSRAIAQLQSTVDTNHNNQVVLDAMRDNQAALRELAQTFNTDINVIQQAICGVKASVEQVGGQVGMTGQQVINAVLLGNKDLTQALQTCCCENKVLAMQNFSAQQLQASQNLAQTQANIENVRQAVVNGFSNIGYQMATDKCDIINANNANTQKIVDTLNNHWQAETALALQDEKFKNSQLVQTQQLMAAINNGCGCNCNS